MHYDYVPFLSTMLRFDKNPNSKIKFATWERFSNAESNCAFVFRDEESVR